MRLTSLERKAKIKTGRWQSFIDITDIKTLISDEIWEKYELYLRALHSRGLIDLYISLRLVQENKRYDLKNVNEDFLYEINSGAYDDIGSYHIPYMIKLRTLV